MRKQANDSVKEQNGHDHCGEQLKNPKDVAAILKNGGTKITEKIVLTAPSDLGACPNTKYTTLFRPSQSGLSIWTSPFLITLHPAWPSTFLKIPLNARQTQENTHVKATFSLISTISFFIKWFCYRLVALSHLQIWSVGAKIAAAVNPIKNLQTLAS